MHALLKALTLRGWAVRETRDSRPLLPAPLARRYPKLPPGLVPFLSALEICENRARNAWFLTARDYRRRKGAGFRWNEYEHMALETMKDDPAACAGITSFWDLHFPFMLAVHSDYDYLAVRLARDGFGTVVHGYAPEWEETSAIAPSFKAFLQAFTSAVSQPQPEYPFNIFLHGDA